MSNKQITDQSALASLDTGDLFIVRDVSANVDKKATRETVATGVAAAIPNGSLTPQQLVTGTGSSWSWQSYTPTWTNLTVGNGTSTSKYTQIGKTVIVHIEFVLGTTSSVSNGPQFSLPVTAVSYTGQAFLGNGLLHDVVVAEYLATIQSVNTTTALIYANSSDSTNVSMRTVTSTVPFSWGTGDKITARLIYEAA